MCLTDNLDNNNQTNSSVRIIIIPNLGSEEALREAVVVVEDEVVAPRIPNKAAKADEEAKELLAPKGILTKEEMLEDPTTGRIRLRMRTGAHQTVAKIRGVVTHQIEMHGVDKVLSMPTLILTNHIFSQILHKL